MTAAIPPLAPGDPEWLKLMTASKVAAVLGVSKWDSPRSMWHKMRGDVPAEESTSVQRRGHYLEPGILAWFFDQHPTFIRGVEVGTVIHPNGWAATTPDATAVDDEGRYVPVEAKTAADDDEWGDQHTDEIPIYYAAQCMWTLHVLGADRIYVPMLTERLEFREYHVDYDSALAADIEAQCWEFYQSLTLGAPPKIDSHPATFDTLKRVNPSIQSGLKVEVTQELAFGFVESRTALARAEAESKRLNSLMVEAMGGAQFAVYHDETVARRQNTASGVAALYAAKPLPTIRPKESAAA